MDQQLLICRADATTQMGTGHVMRCLALGQAWQDQGGRVTFFVSEIPARVRERLESEKFEVVRLTESSGSLEDALRTAELASQSLAVWLVLDGYHFGSEYRTTLRKQLQFEETVQRTRILSLDDDGSVAASTADLILNQNLLSDSEVKPSLSGPHFALLRREFLFQSRQRDIRPEGFRILVTMGGSDPDNVTLKVLESLALLPRKLEVKVLLGAANRHGKTLEAIQLPSNISLEILRNVTEVRSHFDWADLALSAAGSTAWEMCCLGVPMLLIVLAANQQVVAEGLVLAQVAQSLGWHSAVSESEIARATEQLLQAPEQRQQFSRRGTELVDGWGACRVVQALMPKQPVFVLSNARPEDCRDVWQMANEPEVRRLSFRPQPITWEEHLAWFADKMTDASQVLQIVRSAEGTVIGYVRFEGETKMISIALVSSMRGQGYGTAVIKRFTKALQSVNHALRVTALIMPENKPSQLAFTRAGYCWQECTTYREQAAERFLYTGES